MPVKGLKARGGFTGRSSLGALMVWVLAEVCAAITPISAYAQTRAAPRFSYQINGQESHPGKALAVLTAASDNWTDRATDIEHLKRWQLELTTLLHNAGYPIGQVLVTQADADQAQRSDTLRFTVYLGEIGRVDILNTSRVSDERLLDTLQAALCDSHYPDGAGCALETERLERATQLIQDVPGVALAGAPTLDAEGVGIGQTHLTITTVANGAPYTGGLTADNQGSKTTGIIRLGANMSGSNLFGAGDSYNASLYKTDKKMWSGTGGVSAPVGDGGLRWSAAGGRSYYTVNQGVLVDGIADTFSAGLIHPFIRGLDANLNGSLDAVETHTRVSYPDYGLRVHSRLSSLRATFSGNNGDRAQQLGFDQTLGNIAFTLGNQSNDDALDVGPQRAGHYAKLGAAVIRRQNLTPAGDLFAILGVRGQLASKNLDSSEMLGLGGVSGARAYRSDEGSVNQGVVASLDFKWRLRSPWGDQFVPGILVDFAAGQVNRRPWPGWQAGYPTVINVSNRRALSDYGLSLDWVMAGGFTTSAAWARRFAFSEESWVAPGSAQSRVWVTFAWKH